MSFPFVHVKRRLQLKSNDSAFSRGPHLQPKWLERRCSNAVRLSFPRLWVLFEHVVTRKRKLRKSARSFWFLSARRNSVHGRRDARSETRTILDGISGFSASKRSSLRSHDVRAPAIPNFAEVIFLPSKTRIFPFPILEYPEPRILSERKSSRQLRTYKVNWNLTQFPVISDPSDASARKMELSSLGESNLRSSRELNRLILEPTSRYLITSSNMKWVLEKNLIWCDKRREYALFHSRHFCQSQMSILLP